MANEQQVIASVPGVSFEAVMVVVVVGAGVTGVVLIRYLEIRAADIMMNGPASRAINLIKPDAQVMMA